MADIEVVAEELCFPEGPVAMSDDSSRPSRRKFIEDLIGRLIHDDTNGSNS